MKCEERTDAGRPAGLTKQRKFARSRREFLLRRSEWGQAVRQHFGTDEKFYDPASGQTDAHVQRLGITRNSELRSFLNAQLAPLIISDTQQHRTDMVVLVPPHCIRSLDQHSVAFSLPG